MKLLKLIAGLVGGATLGMLYAKKSGKDLRKELKGKSTEEKAKIIGNELLDLGKEVFEEIKDLPENEQVQKLKKLGEEKLEDLYNEIKENGSETIKEILPKIEKTIEEVKKCAEKKCNEAKKKAEKTGKGIAKKASETRKAATKKVNEVKKKLK